MKAETFLEQRRLVWSSRSPIILGIMATPLLLEDGRVDISQPTISRLLREPPAHREDGAKLLFQSDVSPTIRGLAGVSGTAARLEIFRNGHAEYVNFQPHYFTDTARGTGSREIAGSPNMFGIFAISFASSDHTPRS